MEKLELKHLAPYLPYGLNVKIVSKIRNYKEGQIRELKGQLFWDFGRTKREIIKPTLRPLSDLVVGGNGEDTFSDLSNKAFTMNLSNDNWDKFCRDIRKPKGYDLIPHWIFQDLIKNHFDVFGLIEKGLAIDINTLNKQSN